MVKEFIKLNNINAEIISFQSELSIDKILSKKLFPISILTNTILFNTNLNEPFLVILPFSSEPNYSKLKNILDLKQEDLLIEQNNDETINITGYKKGFIPPISIYGIKIFVESSLKHKKFLIFRINEKEFLKIALDAILQSNEDLEFQNLI